MSALDARRSLLKSIKKYLGTEALFDLETSQNKQCHIYIDNGVNHFKEASSSLDV